MISDYDSVAINKFQYELLIFTYDYFIYFCILVIEDDAVEDNRDVESALRCDLILFDIIYNNNIIQYSIMHAIHCNKKYFNKTYYDIIQYTKICNILFNIILFSALFRISH